MKKILIQPKIPKLLLVTKSPLKLLFRCKLRRYCRSVSDFQSITPCRPHCRSLAANVRAAWRRRGVRYSSCGTLTFNFPLHFPRRYTPACAKPPVICWHSRDTLNCNYVYFFHYILNVQSVFSVKVKICNRK